MIKPMEILKLIQRFEPVFIEAANLAKKLKKTATKKQKLSSGIADVDIVTSADLEVQEFILKKLANSDLSNCELIAEEDTKSTSLFSKRSNYVITLDPIDGTKNYAEGGKNYSFIIGIHDKENPLYTFDYYPELRWGIKIVKDKVSYIGKPPRIKAQKQLKTITTYLDISSIESPQKTNHSLHKELINKGYIFANKKTVTKELGATGQFILGITGGYYVENGSAVDCLTGLHFAIANNCQIYRDMDISKTYKSSYGVDAYRGYYLVIRK